jgi:sulfate transport system substrate-binding protein
MRVSLDTWRSKAGAALLAALMTLLAGLAATGCGGSEATGKDSGQTIAVVGYSLPGKVYEEVLEPAFQQTPQGEGVSFTNSFGPSGEQSRAVAAGKPASVVHFSQAGDIERLVKAGDVAPTWEETPSEGMAQNSAVALIVRKGNPKDVTSFNDLLTKNVKIIAPNPSSSGVSRWNIMAIYGAMLHRGRSLQGALREIKTILKKTVVQPPSADDALTAFLHGTGDVLLTLESQGINAAKADENVEYVVPPRTILVETPIAVTKNAPPAAKAFVEFVQSEATQELWIEQGYRPVFTDMVGAHFPTPIDFYPLIEFGGWKKVNHEFFDEKTGYITKIEKELGVPTGG